MPGPSSSTRSTASPATSPSVTVTTDVAWRAALSSRLRTSRCSWTASPSTRAADTPSARTAWPRDRCRATSASTTSSRSTTPRTRGASAPARLVDLCQRQQVGDQLVEALALVQHGRRHVGPVGAPGVQLGHLDARPDRRQRAPQLVGGVRHNWRCVVWAASSRSSMSFIVWARRATSSPVAGSSTRRCSVVCEISSTSWRMRSTGCRARPTSHHVTRPTRTTRTGMPSQRFDAKAWTLVRTSSRGDAATTR